MHPQDIFAQSIQSMRDPDAVSLEHLDKTVQRVCWNCSNQEVRVVPPEIKGKLATICTRCGFIQARDVQATDETVVPEVENVKLFSTIQLQASRNAKYLKILESQIDMQSIGNCLDIGCDQGMLSSLIKAKYPKMDNHGIDPNPEAIQFGQENYPGISLEISALEDYDPKGKTFDLIILTGGLYRIQEPRKALSKMHSWLSKDGILVLPQNISLDDASRASLNSVRDFNDVFRDGYIRNLFSHDQLLEMTSTHFDLLHYGIHSNVTYWAARKSPFYFLKRKAKTIALAPESCTDYYSRNLKALLNYMVTQTGRNLRNALGDGNDRIAIIGVSPEAFALADAALDAGISVSAFLHPLAQHYQGQEHRGIQVEFFDYESLDGVSALVIADFDCADGYLRLFDTHFPELKRRMVFECYPAREDEAIFYSYSNERHQHIPFLFRKPYELTPTEIKKLKAFAKYGPTEEETNTLRNIRAVTQSESIPINVLRRLLRVIGR